MEFIEFKLNNKIVTYNAQQYPLKRGEISKDYESEETSVMMPFNDFPANEFKIFNPAICVYVRIYTKNENKEINLFYGRVSSCSFDLENGTAKLKLITLKAMLKTKVPTRTYSRSCSHDLFDEHCALIKDKFALILSPDDVELSDNKQVITSAKLMQFKSGYFDNGYITYAKFASHIISNKENIINLLFPINFKEVGVLKVYPGCYKIINTCKNKFNNVENYGGFAFVPKKNPVSEGF